MPESPPSPENRAAGLLRGYDLSSAPPSRDTGALRADLQHMLDRLPGFAYRCRNDPDWSMEFVSLNVETITGWSPQALVDNDLVAYGDLIHPEDRDRVWAVVQQAIDEDHAFQIAYRLCTRDGQVKYVQEHGYPRERDGEVVLEGLVLHTAAQHDLDDRLHSRRHLDEMAETVAGLAHDFNNLLGVILGSAGLARDAIDDDHPIAEDLDSIVATTRRAGALNRKLLAFGRQEPGTPRTVALDPCLAERHDLLERVAEGASVEWDLRAPDARIDIDPADLERVVVNAVANARDAAGDAGTIRIESFTSTEQRPGINRWFRWDAGDYVVLAVADEGAGIAAGDLARIFEPRFSTRGHERGLGLASCHGILAKCDGFIQVITHPGAGSTFEFHFPRSEHAGQPRDATPRRTRSRRIVVCQPDGPALPLARMLAGAGFEVEQVDHTDAVLDHCDEASMPPLVVAALPRRVDDEPDLHEQLAEGCPDTPLVYVAASMRPELQHALRGQRIRVLTVPFTRSDLLEVVREHVQPPDDEE